MGEPYPILADPKGKLAGSYLVGQAYIKEMEWNSLKLIAVVAATAFAPVKFLFDGPELTSGAELWLTVSLVGSVVAMAMLVLQRVFVESYLASLTDELWESEQATSARKKRNTSSEEGHLDRMAQAGKARLAIRPFLTLLRAGAFVFWAVAAGSLVLAAATL